VKINYRFNC